MSGYKLGLIIGGSLLLLTIDRIGWSASFTGLAVMLALLTLPVLLFREQPDINELSVTATDPAAQQPGLTYLWQNNRTFFLQPGVGSWLLVLVSYKLADALGSGMVKPMLVDAGFSLSAIGTLTLAASITGMIAAVLGGLLYYRLGPRITLPLFGLLQAAGIAGFAVIAAGRTDITTVYAVSLFEQAADGMSTVALFALMMEQCRPGHEGADYSLQTCLQVILSGMVGMASGWVASRVGYESLFVAAGLLGVMVLVPAWYFLKHRANGERLAKPAASATP